MGLKNGKWTYSNIEVRKKKKTSHQNVSYKSIRPIVLLSQYRITPYDRLVAGQASESVPETRLSRSNRLDTKELCLGLLPCCISRTPFPLGMDRVVKARYSGAVADNVDDCPEFHGSAHSSAPKSIFMPLYAALDLMQDRANMALCTELVNM